MKDILTDAYALARFIKNAEKKTPVKLYIKKMVLEEIEGVKIFPMGETTLLWGDLENLRDFIEENRDSLMQLEWDRRRSAIELLDITAIDARIEPGAIIRDQVRIDSGAVIMMGAVLNIGSCVGSESMIDMNAVLGARATIGKRVHVGAGAVIAGVLEPPSSQPIIIEDDVLIGANAVVLEGVRVGRESVVAAGSVVTEDVEPFSVVAGSPAKKIKMKDDKTREKTKLMEDLR